MSYLYMIQSYKEINSIKDFVDFLRFLVDCDENTQLSKLRLYSSSVERIRSTYLAGFFRRV
jgi:hypothetical protein